MTETITRADLITDIVAKFRLNRQESADILESLLSEISSTLVQGETVKISSFGTFHVRDKKERTGRNPRTGEEAPITPRRVVSFKASPIFKKEVETVSGHD